MSIHQWSDILVVDDSGAVRGVVRKLLTKLGYRCIDEAPEGAIALTKMSEKQFDLVISDWNMEPMSGYELLERVRANKKFDKMRFLMMTADGTIDKIVKAKQAGVNCFIKKPFGAEELQAKIVQINKES
jgi:two-component system chemotaxis response regulator CheY